MLFCVCFARVSCKNKQDPLESQNYGDDECWVQKNGPTRRYILLFNKLQPISVGAWFLSALLVFLTGMETLKLSARKM